MAAHESINKQQFLHGSPVRIPVGEEILPATKVSTPERIAGRHAANRDYFPDRVYMAPHPITALQYTWTDEDIENKNPYPSGYIHVVEPIGRVLKDTSSRDAIIAGARHARGARVIGSFAAKSMFTNQVDNEDEAAAFTNYMNRFK